MISGLGHKSSALQSGDADLGVLFILHRRSVVVCRIILGDNKGGGTGFLIGEDLIMTNNHVVGSLEEARSAKAQFCSEEVEVSLNPDVFFYTSPTPDLLGFKSVKKGKWDFTIVAIHSHPKITAISHLAFSIFYNLRPEKGSNANIIHYPQNPHDGTTRQIVSYQENLIKEISRDTLHYTTATLPGSSGSPVMDNEGNLIALHRAACTHILKALLEEKMLRALLEELFPGVQFKEGTLHVGHREFKGICGTHEGSMLYVFAEGILKGQYYYQGKAASLFRLIETKHTSAKEWALQFLNGRLEEKISECHKECNTAVSMQAIHEELEAAHLLGEFRKRYGNIS